ncbi:formyltetrahydrofolate deformylase [Maridesulfovibrio frigidus]|uniref:formyltetrahydrofolate deformylase n=1 Tax=Maridesulfovibrio frigidus TaxID=340956 RepID=UPI0004E16EA7|nr:formyltetrahydrofolate deformylase [Maridesulfovibrio frigidus]
MTSSKASTAYLTVSCKDRPGIVAAVSGFLFGKNANIIHSDQHSSDPVGGRFFLRMKFHSKDLEGCFDEFKQEFSDTVADKFEMDWTLNPAWIKKKTAILVSKFDHALMDLLWRAKRGELFTEITMVISNHPDLREAVESFGVKFHHIPVNKDKKEESENRILELLDGKVDLIILARYMQILTSKLIESYPNKIINIHHSFLPAFVGADPYRRAGERGVKLIGATAHYVTEELDQGPIIEQDVIRVSHRHDIEELKILGRDIERQVLSRAVKWHLSEKVLVDGNKTVVFI